MLISRYDLTATLITNFNFSVKKCRKYNFLAPQKETHSIIYNGKYNVLNYNNFQNHATCRNISILNKEQIITTYFHEESTFMYNLFIKSISLIETDMLIPVSNSTYIQEVTTKSKEEIFNNITNILEHRKIGISYEIKGENFSILLKPSNSTPLPNKTHVEFDECEQKIRKAYKFIISNSS